jgi:hypothetical protein
MNRIYAIPDIHGRADLLEDLWQKLLHDEKFDPYRDDKIVFLGDMIDRGPWSKLVIKHIRDIEQAFGPDRIIVLQGNHEQFCIKWHRDNPAGKPFSYNSLWFYPNNGGLATLQSFYPPDQRVPDDVLHWMSKLRVSHEEPGFFFSHAPVPRENRRSLVNRHRPFTVEELTWSYADDEFGFARDHGNGVVGICGHIHRLSKGIREPRFYDHYYFLDCGCGCDPRNKAPLVAVELKSRKTIYAYPNETKPK